MPLNSHSQVSNPGPKGPLVYLNIEDPDDLPQIVAFHLGWHPGSAFHLGLHCL